MDKKEGIKYAKVFVIILLILFIIKPLLTNLNKPTYDNIVCGYSCSPFSCESFLKINKEKLQKNPAYEVRAGAVSNTVTFTKNVTSRYCYYFVDNFPKKEYEYNLKNNDWLPIENE